MPHWTNEQKQAIYEKNKNLLIAAAAGSGKTAVLVERIINKAINENVDINKLLIVTFTNAAASEMRERVLDAIYKRLDEDPENENLQRQITLLNISNICTIDSFCLDIVKNNFYELENVSPNFRIADTSEIELLKQGILDEIFEEKYLSEDKNFTELINIYTSYKDDTPLKDLILNIYNYINSSPYPLKWLNEKIEMFNIKERLDENFSKTPWGKVLLKDLEEEINDDITILTDVSKELSLNEELEEWKEQINTDIKQFNILKNNLDNWDKLYEISNNMKFEAWSRKKAKSESAQEEKNKAKEIRDAVKDKFFKKVKRTLITNSKQSNQDIYDMYSILKKLEELIVEFNQKFSQKKREKNIVDFTDIEHFALNILVKDVEIKINENGEEEVNIIKTEIAKKYTEKFEEIAIDEYQDSNLVQEYILRAVSRENNIFMVGDVKQSIYRFRQAMPQLFLDKYHKYTTINDKDNETNKDCPNCLIQLFKNFRSRDNILDFTNLIFTNIMSNELGEVDYNENEYLNFGAQDYKETNQSLKTEIDIINLNKNKDEITKEEQYENYDESDNQEESKQEIEHIENIELEAKYVAQKINDLINSKFQVYDRKEEKFRDIQYKDIAILLRSTKDKANIYEKELINLRIPVFSDSNQEYLDSIEIQTIMSVLKIIDNPMQDIPLVTVLRSNIGGFTDDELVEIRLVDKYDNFYECLQKAKLSVRQDLGKKIEKFLEQISNWRKEQEYLALDELIWKIYSDTGYYNYVGLMTNGMLRQANLKILFERAKKYETASFKGLYNFINFIEKLKNTSGDLGSAKIIGENDNVVRIMSIHKSKGLEFPVVFLVNTNKQFNEQEIRNEPVLMHQDIGIGAKYIDYNLQIKYDTLSREAVKTVIRNEAISEEMRILYVALTRAKEKLFIVGVNKNLDETLEKIIKQTQIYNKNGNKINPILVKKYKTYLDWILLVYEYEKSSISNLIELNKIDSSTIVTKNVKEQEIQTHEDILKKLEKEQKNDNQLKKIKENVEYEYKNKLATIIPTKSSVTKIKEMTNRKIEYEGLKINNKEDYIVKNQKDVLSIEENNKYEETYEIKFEKPKFLNEDQEEKITSTEKGTLVHLCMQNLNPKENYNIEKIKQLLDNLAFRKIITDKEKQVINPYKILEFTKSNIWNDLKNAKEYYKEKPFYINVPAKEIYKEEVDEEILVQGIIDLYFINKDNNIVLVDYKTDYVENGKEYELINKYKKQLELYKYALEKSLNKKVDKVYIYSVYLEKEILI